MEVLDLEDADFDYDEDGIPVLRDVVAFQTVHKETTQPKEIYLSDSPSALKKKHKPMLRKTQSFEDPESEVINTLNESNEYVKNKPPSVLPEILENFEDDSKAVFTIEGEGFDVVLSEKRGKLFLSTMNSTGKRRKSVRRLSGVFRGDRRASISNEAVADGTDLLSFFAAKIKQRPNGTCEGLLLHTKENKDANTLRPKTILMEHPSAELCESWATRIMNYIQAVGKRPTNIKLFLQPYAGNKSGRSLYQKTVLPLFNSALINLEIEEILHNKHAKQELVHLNIDDYDCVACMGGDGTVYQVLDGFLNLVQKNAGIEMRHDSNPVPSNVPFGIIPIGRTNNVANSVMGVADIVTACLHIIYGSNMPVDVCSIYSPEAFLHWGFNSQYGFAAQVLTYMRRYKSLGSKRVDVAFMKALSKAKLRAYECDIEYLPADPSPKAKDLPCRTGCSICWNSEKSELDTVCDLVEELDPLNESFTSNASSVLDMSPDSQWKTIKGKFLNVGLFTISGLCDVAPQGLSKWTHLNDGVMDLIICKETERKEFIRFLRRFGNSKSQLDFPFVESYKVKSIRLRPRFPTGWNYKDHDFNEIQYQMEREEKIKNRRASDAQVEIRSSVIPVRTESIDTLELSDEEDEGEQDEDKDEGDEKPKYIGPQYRRSFTEIEIEKRKNIARKKEEKQKAKEEAKSISLWNIENQMVDTPELDFRVHHGILRISGLGVSGATEYDDVRHGCL